MRSLRSGLAIGLAIVLDLGAWPAWADAYKCVQPGGAVSFQDHPCAGGATGKAIPVVPAAGQSAGRSGAPSVQEQARDVDRRRLDQEARAHEQEIAAADKMQRCNVARQQLGVLKDGGRAFRRDNNGERHYIDDQDRDRETRAAQQRVGDACN